MWADFRDFNLLPKEKEILLWLGEKNNNNNDKTVPSGRHRVARMKLAVKLLAGAAVLWSLGWGGGFTSALPPLAVSRRLVFLTFWLFYHPASHNMTFLFPQSARSRREEDCLGGSTLSFFFVFFWKLVHLFYLEANYFTILWWFSPYIDMNQPWAYMCPPSWPLCLMHRTWTGDLFHTW